ncbi:translocase [Tropicibacter sp. S64]|uniref:translocase n=1 Tax=Tropicibacter sp. S64 TaxID=3415122 RepID=UPI003C7CBB33
MARSKSYILGGATLVCALGIGYIMQFGFSLPGSQSGGTSGPIEVTDITLTTSGLGSPLPPMEGAGIAYQPPAQPTARSEPITVNRGIPSIESADVGTEEAEAIDEEIEMAAAENTAPEQMLPVAPAPAARAEPALACDMGMQAEPAAGAMVKLSLTASCHADERVTIHHQGMMFTEVMSPEGTLDVTVPALSENALFIAAFVNGEGATANAEVSSLPFYDRVAVQWKGETGLQLHAREFDAAYFTPGHVWAEAAGDIGAAAAGEGGFLVRLGQRDAPESLMVEVYSFPVGTAKKSGEVLMSIEAEVTEANCDRQVEAQTLDIREGSPLRVGDLTLEIPACDSVGDFLVLKNIVEDMKVAAR